MTQGHTHRLALGTEQRARARAALRVGVAQELACVPQVKVSE